MRKCLVHLFGVSVIVAAPAQEHREAVWKSLAEQERLIELKWRRDAAGDLEYAPAGKAEAPFARLFANGVMGAVMVSGQFGPAMFLLNPGDCLSLTDGERHLRRLGLPTRDEDLVALVRAPAQPGATEAETLDRLVAVDVLRHRDTAGARAALASLAADEKLAANLRTRAHGGAPARARLDPVTLPLPEAADCWLVIDNARLPDAAWLVDLGRFTSLVSSATVLSLLKEPRENDYLDGETGGEFLTELPFEIVRRLGNWRLDHACMAFGTPEGGWSVAIAGHFEPDAVAKGSAASLPSFECQHAEHSTTVSWPGGAIAVTEHQLRANARTTEVKPRPDDAARVLDLGEAAVRVYLPKNSSLLRMLPGDFQGIEQIDASLTFGADTITVRTDLVAEDAAAAARVAKAIKPEMFTSGPVAWAWLLLVGTREGALRTEAKDKVVHVTLLVPRAQLPTRAKVHEVLIQQAREQRR